MKKRMKSFLSLLCALACALSLSTAAFASAYTYQGNQGQTLMLQSPSDITVNSEDGAYINTINTELNCTQDIPLKLMMSSGMTNFSEETFLSVNLPQITICDTYGGKVLATPTYVSGSNSGIELVIPANTRTAGSYVLVFGKDIQANNAKKTLGQDIVFHFTVSTTASATPDDADTAPVIECPYTDVSEERAEAVMVMVEKGYLTPESNTVFNAAQSVTRGDFVTLVAKCRDINTSKYTASSYVDVADDAAVMPYLEWATAKGLVSGYGKGRFGPADNITREQAARVLHSYATVFGTDKKDLSASISSFADSAAVSSWAKDSVKWAVAAGILTADGENQLNPRAAVTREEMAAWIYSIVM